MLDRIGDEIARATSLVRYAPDSSFPPHTHGGGEEILVLEGEFADEHGRYGAGTYIRNPVGTSHSPRVGPDGATIFVKLHQFQDGDSRQFSIDTANAAWQSGPVPGVEILPLHEFGSELVELYRFAPDTAYPAHDHGGGEEIFVVEGTLVEDDALYPAGSWIRYPDGSSHEPRSASDGALLFVKSGHLPS